MVGDLGVVSTALICSSARKLFKIKFADGFGILIHALFGQAASWKILLLVLLCGLSMGPLPDLQSSFLGDRDGVRKLSSFLRKEGFDLEQFQELLLVLLDPDLFPGI